MNKGYTLKKITVTTYNKAGKEVVKTMKNNSTLKLGEYAYIFDNSYSSGRNYSTSLAARTKITITYIDKYTNRNVRVFIPFPVLQNNPTGGYLI